MHSIVRHNDNYISKGIKDEKINSIDREYENFSLNVQMYYYFMRI